LELLVSAQATLELRHHHHYQELAQQISLPQLLWRQETTLSAGSSAGDGASRLQLLVDAAR